MGVKQLWTLLAPVGRPVLLETMEGKTVAIDSSIWIYQFQATMRDKDGRGLVNAHLVGFLRRICKLLFYGMKPVFVFDGGAPALKKTTLNERRKKKVGAAASHAKVAERLLAAQMRREAINNVSKAAANKVSGSRAPQDGGIDETSVFLEDIDPTAPKAMATPRKDDNTSDAAADLDGLSSSAQKKKANRWQDHDPYNLPAVNLEEMVSKATSTARPDPRLATEEELQAFIEDMRPEDFDVTSEAFLELPTEVQYEIIGDMRLKSRQTSHKRLQSMLRATNTPMDFSMAQIRSLRQRNSLTQQLLSTTGMIGKSHLDIPTRVASERNREYVLIKNEGVDGGWVLGIRDEGTQDKPIKIDHHSDSDGGSDDSLEAVVPPPSTSTKPDADLREYRQTMALSAIGKRYTPKKLAPLTTRPKKPKRPLKALFIPEEGESTHAEEQNDNIDPQLLVAMQESLDEQEAGDLQAALQASLHANSSANSTLGEGTSRSVNATENGPSVPYDSDEDLYVSDRSEKHSGAMKRAISTTSSGADVPPVLSRVAAASLLFGLPTALLEKAETPALSPNGLSPDPEYSMFEEDPPVSQAASAPESSSYPLGTLIGLEGSDDDMEELVPVVTSTTVNNVVPLDTKPDTSGMQDVPKVSTGDSGGEFEPRARSQDLSLVTQSQQIEAWPLASAADDIGSPTFQEFSSLNPSGVNEELGTFQMLDKVERPAITHIIPRIEPTFSTESFPSTPPQETLSVPDEAMEKLTSNRHMEIVVSDDEGVVTDWSRSPSPEHLEHREAVGEDIQGGKRPRKHRAAEEDFDAANEVDTRAEEGDFAQFMSQVKGRDLDAIRQEIDDEIRALNKEKRAAMRDSDDITLQMISQIKTMLKLFGIPYVVAPMEAEAQCAALVELGLVDGIITDDSDVFLFGGKRVFRNMFNQSKTVECFLLSDLSKELGLHQNKLIRLAYLLGSDYTEGLPGVGPVVAMEILKEFGGEDGLIRFREWWSKVQSGKDKEDDTSTKFRKRFKKKFKDLYLAEDWPNPVVRDAYQHPTIDDSRENFKWALPDLDGLRGFLGEELGWSTTKVDDTVLPIVRKVGQRGQLNAINRQSNLNGYFDISAGSGTFAPKQKKAYASKRLQKVVSDFRKNRSRSGSLAQESDSEQDHPPVATSSKGKGKAKDKTKAQPKARAKPRQKAPAKKRRKLAEKDHDEGDSDKADTFEADEETASTAALMQREEAPKLRPRPRMKPKPVVVVDEDEDMEGSSDEYRSGSERKRKV